MRSLVGLFVSVVVCGCGENGQESVEASDAADLDVSPGHQETSTTFRRFDEKNERKEGPAEDSAEVKVRPDPRDEEIELELEEPMVEDVPDEPLVHQNPVIPDPMIVAVESETAEPRLPVAEEEKIGLIRSLLRMPLISKNKALVKDLCVRLLAGVSSVEEAGRLALEGSRTGLITIEDFPSHSRTKSEDPSAFVEEWLFEAAGQIMLKRCERW
jgi:hypothetical protein